MISKDEIEEQLVHQRKMVRALRLRLQQRELQEAQQGINVAPEVKTEIFELSERIQGHEAEIKRLQSLAAEDQLPIAEVEYRVLLAEAWDTPKGVPSVAGAAQLELARLRLGVTVYRAHEIEHEVRVALAEEKISNFDARLLYKLSKATFTYDSYIEGAEADKDEVEALRILARAIRLDYVTTARWLASRTRKPEDATVLRRYINAVNGIWRHSSEYALLIEFEKVYREAAESYKQVNSESTSPHPSSGDSASHSQDAQP